MVSDSTLPDLVTRLMRLRTRIAAENRPSDLKLIDRAIEDAAAARDAQDRPRHGAGPHEEPPARARRRYALD